MMLGITSPITFDTISFIFTGSQRPNDLRWDSDSIEIHRAMGKKLVLFSLICCLPTTRLNDRQHDVARTTDIFGVKSKDLKISIGTSRYLGMQ